MNLNIIIKIICFYLLTVLLFLKIDNNEQRLIGTSILYLFGLFLFKINLKFGLLFISISLLTTATEHIYIKYMKNTWTYKNPQIGKVPYWLLPLWGNGIIIISEIIKLLN
jgi:hypothetical protein